ncbi:MAG: 4-hydroxybenzoate octaprenyltransferase [Candidatus Pelagibacter sp.]|nr:4-hydroxybenzoate octaprenyltransferase [Candidatus Pelagibacter sp.]OUW23316.1 MAG: 4-hydroxybenzoate polyprenyltransferase [Rickettsiales bacterium TMED174]|tara:strand:+ start:505 stop:1353 length:849 start_codon:yes stop_codon:yes gene_type:complete
MTQIKLFINLIRIKKPVGFMLLFWPCAWGLAYANGIEKNENFFYYLILFFLGSVLMRSAGCIFNDFIDKNYDYRVKRTKDRPIASGKISPQRALVYTALLCMLAFLILIQFNMTTIFLGLISMILAFSYPFMKRITYWPQLFLGLTFNWGIIMAWAAMGMEMNLNVLILYLAAIFWTLGYDTIYGVQDMSDDEIIGLKSTAIKFKNNIKLFVGISYSITIILLFYLLNKYLGINLVTALFLVFVFLKIFQVYYFDKKDSQKCLKAFKLNNLSGISLFLVFAI